MTDSKPDHEQAVERLIANIAQVEGRVVTRNDEVAESNLAIEPAVAEIAQNAMIGEIPAFQVKRDDDRVYCRRCKTEHQRTQSDLGLHNQRRHAEEVA